MQTSTTEDYLKAIFKLSGPLKKGVSTNAISEELSTKASSVSDMVKKLSDKKLVHYVKYQGTTLTKEGEKIALKVIRKHRLWEVFLVEKLNFTWDEVHEVAEELEHIKSEKLINELDRLLDFPKNDPHGDPIHAEPPSRPIADLCHRRSSPHQASHSAHRFEVHCHLCVGVHRDPLLQLWPWPSDGSDDA